MKRIITVFVFTLVFVLLISSGANVFAAGKSIEAFKCNNYSGTNDCQKMISEITGYDSAYSSYETTVQERQLKLADILWTIQSVGFNRKIKMY